MTEEKVPKVKPINYNIGNGDYLVGVPTSNGYNFFGYISGEHVQIDGKDIKEIEEKISNYSKDANNKFMNKAIRFEEIALRIKEGGLEKYAQRDGDNKTDLNWVKD